MPRPTNSRGTSFAWVVVAYAAATVAALLVAARLPSQPLWLTIAAADFVATVVVFVFSLLLDNSSVYDPYWSVAPLVIAPALALTAAPSDATVVRKAVVLTFVFAWGVRLTFNWARGWRGLGHEDWRYAERRRMGRAYWLVSFAGFHLMPTIWVYLGCLPLIAALVTGTRPLSWIDAVACVVTASAVGLEAVADQQLRKFRLANPTPGAILDTGVWARCRHPNYAGEMGFWWGLFLFGIAAQPSSAWTIVGALSITCLFVFVSTPMLDRRSLDRRPGYAKHMKEVPALLPRLGARADRLLP